MKTITKKILIVSSCLMAAGVVIGGIGFIIGGRPGIQITSEGISSTPSNSEPCQLKKTKLDSFSEAKITVDSYADIQILPSDDNNYYLEYRLDKSYGKPKYTVDDDVFTFQHQNLGVHFLSIGILYFDDLSDTYVHLYVPKGKVIEYMHLYNDTGDVSISDVNFTESKIAVDYGGLTLDHTRFGSLDLHLDSGDFTTEDTKISDLTLKNEYGNNELNQYKGDFITAKLDTSSLTIDAVELKSLDCDVEYGDVDLTLPGKLDDYTFDISVEYGDIQLPDGAPKGHFRDRDDEEEYYQTNGDGKRLIHIESDTGDVEIFKR